MHNSRFFSYNKMLIGKHVWYNYLHIIIIWYFWQCRNYIWWLVAPVSRRPWCKELWCSGPVYIISSINYPVNCEFHCICPFVTGDRKTEPQVLNAVQRCILWLSLRFPGTSNRLKLEVAMLLTSETRQICALYWTLYLRPSLLDRGWLNNHS